ncbi:MAG: hypothetical protein HPY60_00345 [Candidatus Methanofastidiosum sp.]|nr:hypothetical protein [Methanofastidiosum sp.]
MSATNFNYQIRRLEAAFNSSSKKELMKLLVELSESYTELIEQHFQSA